MRWTDTPASAVALLTAMRDAGYDVGADGDIPGLPATGRPAGDGDGDTLIHALIERGGQDPDWLTSDQLAGNPIRVPARQYREWFSGSLPGSPSRLSNTGVRRRESCSSTPAPTPTAIL